MPYRELKVFSGSSNLPLARKVSEYLGIPLGEMELRRFSDGEISVKILENVRGGDVFIIQSTGYPAANEYIMELLLIVDAFRRASANRITAVIPYYGYARQDRKVEPRVPISAKVVATLLETCGVNRVLAMDLHADQIQGFFQIPVDHLFAAPVIIEYLRSLPLDWKNTVVVSPDSGGAHRARFYAKQLMCGLAIVDKRRKKPNEAEIMHIVGEVEGKDCLLIDDMIDTGGTILKATQALLERGAKKIYAVATHGVLSGEAISRLSSSSLEEVIITDTIFIPPEKRFSKLQILSVSHLIGEAIRRIHKEESVSSLFL